MSDFSTLDYHDNAGIRVLLSETRDVSVHVNLAQWIQLIHVKLARWIQLIIQFGSVEMVGSCHF